MDGSSAYRGIACTDCEARPATEPLLGACPNCGGRLEAQYEFDEPVDPSALRASDDQYRFAPLLPLDRDSAVTIGEGATPLIDCPTVAETACVDRLLVKDEGENPTGSIADRGASIAVTAAAAAGAETAALPTTGHAGRAVAAYAGRAGLEAKVFVPARAPFACKAMVNVHGGEMTVVGGQYPAAERAFEDERDPGWADLGPGSPTRREGAVSMYGEVLAALEWTAPDAILVPAGHGTTVAGVAAAIERFDAAGLAADRPRIHVAQPAGCSPIVDAIQANTAVEPVENPDTIAGALEVPDPALGERAADAVRELGGETLSVADEDALVAAVDAVEGAGVEVGVAGGVALAGQTAADLPADGTVVVLNPTAGGTESDVLRSHLMSQGL